MDNAVDPRAIIAQSPMSHLQIAVVILCLLLNALDGFDVLAISFASPGIAHDWGIDRAVLGVVLSMELIGMAVGSVAIGHLADQVGRRPMIIGCLVIMSGGMYLAVQTHDVFTLSGVRFFTGLGIGGMLATSNAMTAEVSNARRKYLAVSLMAAGYPIGAIIGGLIAAELLIHSDWRTVFLLGAAASALCLPLVFFWLPESIDFLAQRQPPQALPKINRILQRMGHRSIDRIAAAQPEESRGGIGSLLSGKMLRVSLLLITTYFTHIMTFYYVLKWIPKIVVDMGFAASAAGGILIWANLGGALGSLLLSVLTQRYNVRVLVIGSLFMAFVAVAIFGHASADLLHLACGAAVAGFFTNAAVVGLYALFTQTFPAHMRASGTGLVIGIGRGGAALGPIIAGFLFAGGQSFAMVSFLMAIGSLIAAAAVLGLGANRSSLPEQACPLLR